ncbi:MAG: DUF6338 family protein [bacterium]
MNITEFTIRLLLLFFPGIICAYIVDAFTIHKPRETFLFLLQSFVFGLSSYFLFWVVLIIYNFVGSKLTLWSVKSEVVFLRALADSKVHISYSEIVWVCIISVLLAIVITIITTYKIHFKIVQWLRITKKFGELDVWGYTFNMKEVNWVTVRDMEKDLAYDGWVQSFSDDSKDAELLLRDVRVYQNSSGEFLYQVDMMYISRNRDNIAIEIRNIFIDS